MNDIILKLEKKAHCLRKQILETAVETQTGHITSSFSCVDILTAMYCGRILRYNADNPDWEERDYFLLSKGHAGPAFYAILADAGYFPKEHLKYMGTASGKIGVHIQHDIPGVEATSGSLGHGLGIAGGIASAMKKDKKKNLVFTLLGDGECYEGSVWESAMFCGANHLNNLIVVIDRNYLCATDFTENLLSIEPFEKKWDSFGFETRVVDGHSMSELMQSFDDIRCFRRTKPLVIIANTVKGKGIDMYENDPLAHGASPRGENAKKAKIQLEEVETSKWHHLR